MLVLLLTKIPSNLLRVHKSFFPKDKQRAETDLYKGKTCCIKFIYLFIYLFVFLLISGPMVSIEVKVEQFVTTLNLPALIRSDSHQTCIFLFNEKFSKTMLVILSFLLFFVHIIPFGTLLSAVYNTESLTNTPTLIHNGPQELFWQKGFCFPL